MRNYRAQPIDPKQAGEDGFVYGFLIEDAHGKCFIASTDDASPPIMANKVKSLTGSHDIVILGAHEIIPSTVGQDTGLKDKNKKSGYAGDKVNFFKELYMVKWRDCNAGFYLESVNERNPHLHISNIVAGEVIGTIHDKESP